MATAGYSGTPLPKKLGLKEGETLVLLNPPEGIEECLAPLPTTATLSGKLAASNRLVILFCKDTATMMKSLSAVSEKLDADGSLWISWPKNPRRCLLISPKTAFAPLRCRPDSLM